MPIPGEDDGSLGLRLILRLAWERLIDRLSLIMPAICISPASALALRARQYQWTVGEAFQIRFRGSTNVSKENQFAKCSVFVLYYIHEHRLKTQRLSNTIFRYELVFRVG